MKLPRRKFLRLAASATALPALSRVARAQAYPTRPVRIVVGYPAGTGPDTIARLMAQWLTEKLGQQFIIDNRPGAGSNIGAEVVAKAPPDGYTLLFVTSANAVNATLYVHLSFDFVRDIAPVGTIGQTSFVVVVNPAFPPKTIPEFIAYAKANPGKINMASQGNGSIPHVAGELFNMMAGIEMLHIPYRSNPLPDLLAGQVQVYFGPIPTVIGNIRAGTLRALAVSSATPSEVLPAIPTIGEFVPGYEAVGRNGIGAPKDTPTEITEKLNREINAGLADAKLRGQIAELGSVPTPLTTTEFSKIISSEVEKWGKVVKFTGIKLE